MTSSPIIFTTCPPRAVTVSKAKLLELVEDAGQPVVAHLLAEGGKPTRSAKPTAPSAPCPASAMLSRRRTAASRWRRQAAVSTSGTMGSSALALTTIWSSVTGRPATAPRGRNR